MEKTNLVILTQNVKLESLVKVKSILDSRYLTVLVTTHLLFENELKTIHHILGDFTSLSFADFLTDREMEQCDYNAYSQEKDELSAYYSEIKKEKNRLIISKISKRYDAAKKILACDDLGIDVEEWTNAGFQRVFLDYYHVSKDSKSEKKVNKISIIRNIIGYLDKPIYTTVVNNKKYIFYGRLERIQYRLEPSFRLDRKENWIFLLTVICAKFFRRAYCRKNIEHISTLHESTGFRFPKLKDYHVGIIQDGYLPPNYSSYYLKFIPPNVYYYAWDTLGMQVFRNQGIPVKLLPFRKKLYIPDPVFRSIKKVLCIASGAGDWTAMKNRSDEDAMIVAFVEIAKKHPEINFVYRCHPTWVHPDHQGVNSINRVAEFFAWLGLPNLTLSGNIPSLDIKHFQLSISRNSLEEDLKSADFVFGEHSVSMIDAAFKQIPFASVNVTGRRNFFVGMTNLGFPHCESIDDIESVLSNCEKNAFIDNYKNAVARYNKMTDEEYE